MTVDLATRRHGSPAAGAPALVLLHAFPLHSAMWDGVLAVLDRQLDPLPGSLLLVDLPGLGASPVPAGQPDLAVSADAVVAAMDAEGIDRAVLAGVSMGGYVALAIARRHPERLAGLGLIDTKATADGEEARANRERVAQAVTGAEGTQALLPSLDALLGETTRRDRPQIVERVRGWMLDANAAGVAWSQRAMAGRPDSTDVLASLSVSFTGSGAGSGGLPVAVVVGAEDGLTPLSEAEAMVAALTGDPAAPSAVTLTVVPAAGHLAAIEQPEPVAQALAALWASSRPA